jgi:gamma-glutamyltranspeptidase
MQYTTAVTATARTKLIAAVFTATIPTTTTTVSLTQQLLCHLLEGCLDPQTAIDRPRFCILGGEASGDIAVEDAMPAQVVTRLREMGHKVQSLLLLTADDVILYYIITSLR